ncbi:sporulation protein [Flavobacterium branchiophilum]|uniref:Sporulation related protein n=1 Tax=Flavobacterium branchiophilum TaxID=55197 RepID=A0A543G303_9FLAO|nr:SPOR domain-containing protein [Flavobacterium branchiophilum]OXA77475.1 sporulation protein [Flavobacterium branchiophilum] [Flavobacterium branchiophilum NBRC 15030 = ATCC 35035]TQM40470.1 sporulation related protein [Flavobacterium branchiophilum]GEM56221.1 hypothetical protein FB1_24420 [Flavobacterium branchiophilum NBRC 15030 = ATCC 35035]
MKIEQSISQLLYRYQCVIVPGFGAFLTEIQSAKIQENSNTFLPPKKQISFNSQIVSNDGLLANYIAQTEKSTYENAMIFIEFEVDNWLKKLQNNESVLFKNVGEVGLNENRNMIFKPFDEVNYLASSFGLSQYVAPVVERVIETVPDQENSVEETPSIAKVSEPTISKQSYGHYFKYAAVLVLASGIGTVGGINMYEKKIAQQTFDVENAVQKKIENKIQTATFFIDNPITESALETAAKPYYHIMAGSFKNDENAQKKYNQLIQDGYQAKVLPVNEHGLIPVVYGSFSSYSDAKTVLNEVQNKENPEAWILIKAL